MGEKQTGLKINPRKIDIRECIMDEIPQRIQKQILIFQTLRLWNKLIRI